MKTREFLSTWSSSHDPASSSRWLLGLALLALSTCGSLLLVLLHFKIVSLPGCEPPSVSTDISISARGTLWGRPVSFMAFAYFSGLLASWTMLNGIGVSLPFRTIVVAGAVVSLGCLVSVFWQPFVCWYSLITNISNVCFSIVVQRCASATGRTLSSVVVAIAVFMFVSAVLTVAVSEQTRFAHEQRVREIYQTQNDPLKASAPPTMESGNDLSEGNSTLQNNSQPADVERPFKAATEPNAGRVVREPYRLGPADARLQLVVFYDYQDFQSAKLDQEIGGLIARYGDEISVTVRHYPMCEDCNFLLDTTTHPNACRAALVAEAAGLIRGAEGFWQMQRWLFENAGLFTEDELRKRLADLKYEDVEEFIEVMNSPRALANVTADIVNARSLQVTTSPAVRLNGANLAGPQLADVLALSVSAAMEGSPASASELQGLSSNAVIDQNGLALFPLQMQLTAWQSTVRVINKAGRIEGSGAIISQRPPFVYVLTASHLIDESDTVEIQTFNHQPVAQLADSYPASRVIAQSESLDLALVRFSSRQPLPTVLQIADPHQMSQPADFPVLSIGIDGAAPLPTCVVTQMLGSKLLQKTPDSPAVKVWEVGFESVGGRSGGPLVDLHGGLLGIASGVSSGKAYFCHLDEIRSFLEQNALNELINSKN